MKQSHYNFYFLSPDGEHILAYNGISQGLCALDQDVFEQLELLKSGQEMNVNSELLAQLKVGGYIIENDFSELDLLRHRQYMSQYANPALSLTIAPTINCNLACPYCFESHVKGKMSKEVINGIADFVLSRVKEKKIDRIDVTWYGGEPLLYPDVIEDLSQKLILVADEYQIPYQANVITNGTKYTPEIAAMLKRFRVKNIQITIDGNKWTHDCRRINKGGGGSFDKIMSNIQATLGILPISIRINVDRENVAFGIETFEYFKMQPWFDADQFNFYFGWVRKFTKHVEGVDESVLSPEEFHAEAEALNQHMLDAGHAQPDYPKASFGCVATNMNGFVIGPKGDLWKCWTTIGDKTKAFGNVLSEFRINGHFLEYMHESWENDEECRSCKVLPLCMGGCGDIRIKRKQGRLDHKDCGVWRYHIHEKLKQYAEGIAKKEPEPCADLPFEVPMSV